MKDNDKGAVVAVLIILGVLVLIPAYVLLGGFIWMIGLGILSHIFEAPNLAISYWQSVVVSLVVGILLGGLTRAARSKD